MKKSIWFTSFLILIFTLLLVPAAMAGWTKVAPGGQHNLAIDSDGNIWAWGRNDSGQVGDGTTTNRSTPVKIATAADGPWIDIATGSVHSLALKKDGTVWAWGANGSGQIGNGGRSGHVSPQDSYYTTRQQVLTPDPASPLTNKIPLTGIKAIVSGNGHNLALDINGNVWGWGYSYFGSVGNGSNGPDGYVLLAAKIDLTSIESVHAGGDSSMALAEGGTERYAWGSNIDGVLGLGVATPDIVSTPISNFQFSITSGCHWTDIKIGYYHSLGYVACGIYDTDIAGLYGWGSNQYSQLGLVYYSGTPSFNTPQLIFPFNPPLSCEESSSCYPLITQSFTASGNHSHGVFQTPNNPYNPDPYLLSWGISDRGEMGDYSNDSLPHLPEPIYLGEGGGSFQAVWGGGEHVLALSDGFLYGWGDDTYGQVGDDNLFNFDGKVQVYPAPVLIDSDGDDVPDIWDTCPSIYNPVVASWVDIFGNTHTDEQPDFDQDGIGDACDNCPRVSNYDQKDTTGSGMGDACSGKNIIPPATPSSLTLTPQSGTLIKVDFYNGTGSAINTFPPDCFNTTFILTDSTGNVLPALDRIGPPYNILNYVTIAAGGTQSVTCDLSLMYLPKYLVSGATYAVEAWYSNYIQDPDWGKPECSQSIQCVDLWQGALHSTGVVNLKPTYHLTGFFSPVDNWVADATPPVENIAKAGQTIPIKWRLTYLDGSGVPTNNNFSYSFHPCPSASAASQDDIGAYTTDSAGLKYLNNGNWQYNWKTDKKNDVGKCWDFKLDLADGSDSRSARFRLK